MFKTADKIQKYNIKGALLSKCVQREVGKIFFEERCRRQITLDEIKETTELARWRVARLEQGCKLNWCVLAMLLEFYKKKLDVRLIDEKQEQE